jgi:putative Ca2+/H+ antiporter (TMEM165/GDT1 family)
LQPEEDGSELKDAEESMHVAEKEGKISAKTRLSALAEVASLIFIAEWGDRSMLATIGLAVHKSAYGVFAGASLGHVVATLIAVIAGSFASKYISEKTVNLVGGMLFLVFGVDTALGLGFF